MVTMRVCVALVLCVLGGCGNDGADCAPDKLTCHVDGEEGICLFDRQSGNTGCALRDVGCDSGYRWASGGCTGVAPDMAVRDLSVPPDLTVPDLAVTPPDLYHPPPDLPPPDLLMPDLMPPPLWVPQSSGVSDTLNGVWGSSATDVYVVGNNGVILHSGDGGATWQKRTSGTSKSLFAVWGADASNVWAVGYGGTILYSADGVTWNAQASATAESLLAVHGTDPSTVYAVGTNGTIRALGGGGNWTTVASPVSSTLFAAWAMGPGDLFAAGDQLIHTVNGGSSWSQQTLSTIPPLSSTSEPVQLWALLAFGADMYTGGLIQTSSYGAVYASTNAGASWTPGVTYGIAVRALWAPSLGDLFVAGDWVYHAGRYEVYGPFNAMWGAGSSNVWAVGLYGRIYRKNY